MEEAYEKIMWNKNKEIQNYSRDKIKLLGNSVIIEEDM